MIADNSREDAPRTASQTMPFELIGRGAFAVNDKLVIDYLDALGSCIARDREARHYPDLMAFGFWCRRKNVLRQVTETSNHQVGVGTLLHIAPSNIPMTFAYSLALGLLAGNYNIVRLPSKSFPQVELLIRKVSYVARVSEFSEVGTRFAAIRTHRDDAPLLELVEKVDGLVVWGGDETVSAFRRMSKSPKCREVYFPDRKSSTLIASRQVAEASDGEMKKLIHDFYNDTYQVDQNACSSPSSVVWVGEGNSTRIARKRFWTELSSLLHLKYQSNSTVGVDKLLDLFSLVESLGKPTKVEKTDNLIFLYDSEESRRGNLRYGQFYECNANNLSTAANMLRGDEQTITYFGFHTLEIEELMTQYDVSVDRACPVGQALNIGAIWDGKNVIEMLSRTLSII